MSRAHLHFLSQLIISNQLLNMGWFWADTPSKTSLKPAACPVKHDVSSPAACPVNYGKGPLSDDDEVLNPMNNMPMAISSERAPGQRVVLSTERTVSSIPRGESGDQGFWEYPSPQQMLNAMLKKGKGQGVPEDAVELMVEVHNFLNEGAWQQILEWESKYTAQLRIEPRLLQFTGKPHDLSPRARMYLALGKVFPLTFNTQPPFDRHDWTVLRAADEGKWDQVRYVIDYYSAPDDEETGMPAFMLDTRPALDSVQNALDRLTHWAGPLWKRAMGDFD